MPRAREPFARPRPLRPLSVSSQIVALLREHGPMTRLALGGLIPGVGLNTLSTAVTYLAKDRTKYGGRKVKRVYIKRWDVDDALGDSRVYPRPVYAAGNRPNAPKPAPKSQTERNKARWAKKRIGRGVPNSVFALAGTCT
jgi:hypothetical protein